MSPSIESLDFLFLQQSPQHNSHHSRQIHLYHSGYSGQLLEIKCINMQCNMLVSFISYHIYDSQLKCTKLVNQTHIWSIINLFTIVYCLFIPVFDHHDPETHFVLVTPLLVECNSHRRSNLFTPIRSHRVGMSLHFYSFGKLL